MKTIMALMLALGMTTSAHCGGVSEIVATATKTCGVASLAGCTFTNLHGGSTGWRLLEADIWGWNSNVTNVTLTITCQPQGAVLTNTLGTVTSTADVTMTNGTSATVFYSGSTVQTVMANGDVVVIKPSVTNQSFSASLKFEAFMRQ
jgi:hypothetical protein